MNLTKIKSAVPMSVKLAINRCVGLQRRLTGRIRLLPDFIVIGAQRCGTTSLYNYLIRHPHCVPATRKEIHFFDINFSKGVTWYRSHFPTYLYKYYCEIVHQRDFVTGEASPYYFAHPSAPRRISEIVPSARLVLLLRNPVDRAYSHYRHEVRKGRETSSSLEEAIDREEQRLRGEMERMLADEDYYSFNHHRYSYLSRGIYIDQLRVWADFFPKEQILVLESEDFFADTPVVFKQVVEFLNMPDWEPREYRNYNRANNPEMESATRKRLIKFFEPHNRELYEYLGRDLDWDR